MTLTEQEIIEYARGAVEQMSASDIADFVADPESWRDGITTNHVIACRDGQNVYIDSNQEWESVRDAILAVIESD